VVIAANLAFDSNDTQSLLRFAAAGNSVFLAAQYMRLPELLDTLRIGVNDTLAIALRDSLKVSTSLVNPRLGGNRYQFQRTFQNTSFFEFDSLTSAAAVLGRNSLNTPDFIRVGFGRGAFYLHLQPLAFSNYYVLNDTTTDYAFKALSYLPPDRDIIWDEYIHQGRVGDHSIMRVVMSMPALQWAYYTAIFGILLFVIFEGKRRQRIIPAIQPLQNTTLEFVNIVSRLYFQKQDHHGIARKKTLFFLEHVRTQYHLPTNRLDEDFAETLSHKSGYPLEKTKYLVWKIGQITTTGSITADGLLKLNDDIEHFYATTARNLYIQRLSIT
jgi:hypothetical protein